MAAFLDNCRFNATSAGTVDFVYSNAVAGCQSPAAAGAVNGRTYKYRAETSDLSQWEIGEGAYNTATNTLTRVTVHYNSSGTGIAAGQSGAGTKINFATVPQVAVVAIKTDLVSIEEANAFSAAQQAQARSNIAAAAAPGSWTRTVFTSGSGTYTTKAGCKALLVRLVGGGGGGGGGSGTAGGAGGSTTFGTSFLVAGGGGQGAANASAPNAGTASSGGDINLSGLAGNTPNGAGGAITGFGGSAGGNSIFGGGGYGGWNGSAGSAGGTNTGGGGGGGGSGTTNQGGGGGGAGGYCEKLITAPAASYAYSVGAGGTSGAAGGGFVGGVGGSGIIIIDEYY
ncbi:hypothetical protein ACQR1I_16565 [Bradyrhizobium sp. HKCCYLS2038]|uniref:hypothetical protein n=1 Tax=unclassified Bradyrhizobium TaxID=2631580 RepID=UPI003EBF93BC